jgi:hypothetical protein
MRRSSARPRRSRTACALGVALVSLGLCVVPIAAQAADPPPTSVTTAAPAFNFSKWAGGFVKWVYETPASQSPLNGKGTCQTRQSRKLFFLGVHMGHQTVPCVVPAGEPILVSPAFAECSNAEPFPFHGDTDAQLTSCVKTIGKVIRSAFVSVDGRPMHITYALSPPFTIDLPAGNLFGSPLRTTRSVAAAWMVFVPGLAPGPHVIRASSLLVFFGQRITGDVTYELTVR